MDPQARTSPAQADTRQGLRGLRQSVQVKFSDSCFPRQPWSHRRKLPGLRQPKLHPKRPHALKDPRSKRDLRWTSDDVLRRMPSVCPQHHSQNIKESNIDLLRRSQGQVIEVSIAMDADCTRSLNPKPLNPEPGGSQEEREAPGRPAGGPVRVAVRHRFEHLARLL